MIQGFHVYRTPAEEYLEFHAPAGAGVETSWRCSTESIVLCGMLQAERYRVGKQDLEAGQLISTHWVEMKTVRPFAAI